MMPYDLILFSAFTSGISSWKRVLRVMKLNPGRKTQPAKVWYWATQTSSECPTLFPMTLPSVNVDSASNVGRVLTECRPTKYREKCKEKEVHRRFSETSDKRDLTERNSCSTLRRYAEIGEEIKFFLVGKLSLSSMRYNHNKYKITVFSSRWFVFLEFRVRCFRCTWKVPLWQGKNTLELKIPVACIFTNLKHAIKWWRKEELFITATSTH